MIDKLVSFVKNSSKEAKIVMVGFFAIVVIALIAAIVALSQPKWEVETIIQVADFEESTNVPGGYRKQTELLLGAILESNEKISDIASADAVIREGSYKEEKNDNDSTSASFIIDIASLRYSFQVKMVWPKSAGNGKPVDPDIVLSCPYYLDVIYTDKKCIAETAQEQIKQYLPHYGLVPGREGKYSVTMREYDNYQQYGGEKYLAVEYKECGDHALYDAVKESVDSWIKSVYLDPNDYHIEIIDMCGRK